MDGLAFTVQFLLGLGATTGALLKLTMPYERCSQISSVARSKKFKPEHLRLIGVLELGGGIGLVLPLIPDALNMLTPLVALGIALYMAGAMSIHLRRSEYGHMVGNLVVFLMPALFIASSSLERL